VTGAPVVRWEIMGSDAPALWSFYRELFGWKIASHGGYGMVDAGDGGIPGAIGAASSVEPRVTVYVEVPSVADALERAEELGGAREMGPMRVRRRVELGHFRDPEGHLIGLIAGGSAERPPT
jgi:predicted enzyme related to lactoylglutathione lyase